MRRFLLLPVCGLLLAACGSPSAADPSPAASLAAALPSAAASVAPAPTVEPTATVPAATPTPAALSNEQIAEAMRASTVRVVAEFGETAIDYEGLGAGTGIVYDLENGYIITNAHVVEGAAVIKVALADSTRTRPARVVGRSQCDDLAVLKVDNTDGMAAATLGDSGAMKPGADVVALGYPFSFDLGNDLSVNPGTVSQLNVQLDPFEELIKTDAAINPGNSGGPLVNARGEVIGINTLGFSGAQNTNYAIAMSQARPIIKQLEQGNNRNYLGLNLVANDYVDFFGVEGGMAVIGVASGSPAAQAKLAPVDLLLKIEGKTIQSEADVCNVLRSHNDGDVLAVEFLRGETGELFSGSVTIGKGAVSELTKIGQLEGTEAPADNAAAGADANYTTLVSTNFDNDDPGSWTMLQDADIDQSVQNGEMVVRTLNPEVTMSMTPPEAAAVANGFVSARVRIEGNGYAGIIVRSNIVGDSRSKYACTISNESMVDCYKQINNEWTAMVGPKHSDLVKPNEYNDLALVAEDRTLTFLVNGEEAATFRNDELAQGEFGVYTEPSDSPFTAFFDDIVIGEF